MPVLCSSCVDKRAVLKRPKTGHSLCKDCFFWAFEEEVHQTIVAAELFKHGETVGIAASGGKDSTVLAHVMKLLNERYNYGLTLMLLSVDEGITGYRDDSVETVKRNQQQYELPLKIVVLRGALWLDNGCHREAGHNADDVAETVLMNVLRASEGDGVVPRCKPLKYAYEKEIVLYAYFKKTFLKDLESVRPSSIMDVIHSGENLSVRADVKMPTQGTCARCGYISSQPLCKSCVLLEGLNRGLPKLGIGKHHRL
ncbi:unnamed protein product, partial [Tetraodon nigroviridis]